MIENSNTVSDNQKIIEDLFKGDDKIPVFDTRAYELPNSLWLDIKKDIEDYIKIKHHPALFAKIRDVLVNYAIAEFEDDQTKFNIFTSVFQEHVGIIDKTEFATLMIYPDRIDDLAGLNERLCDDLRENGYRIDIDKFVKQEQQNLSQFKRRLVRNNYYDWDSTLSDTFFKEDSDFINYPLLMIDRMALQVYSKDYMTFSPKVKKQMKPSDFMKVAAVEALMYRRLALLEDGYAEKDIEDYFNNHLLDIEKVEEDYNFIKHRSVLPSFKLTDKPRIDKSAYWWKEEGITYRFKFDAQTGAPLSMFILPNMQRLVYWRLKEKYPEIEDAFNEELLEETNFIPMGWEEKYLEHEQIVLDELKDTARGTYMVMLERLGFDGGVVRGAQLVTNLHQIEVCWNNRLPLDPINHMQNRASNYYSYGLASCRLDYNTPLFVTKYNSDIEPNEVRFSHKIYRKTKKNLRQEIVLGNELKQKADVGKGRMPLGENFFVDAEATKKRVYANLVFHHIRRTEGFEKELYKHGYHEFDNCELEFTEDDKRRVMDAMLRAANVPEGFQDLDLFSNFVRQIYTHGYVNRAFFRGWTDKMFRNRVINSTQFERMSRGRYRVKRHGCFKAIIKDFKRVDKQLSLSVDLDAVEACEGSIDDLF